VLRGHLRRVVPVLPTTCEGLACAHGALLCFLQVASRLLRFRRLYKRTRNLRTCSIMMSRCGGYIYLFVRRAKLLLHHVQHNVFFCFQTFCRGARAAKRLLLASQKSLLIGHKIAPSVRRVASPTVIHAQFLHVRRDHDLRWVTHFQLRSIFELKLQYLLIAERVRGFDPVRLRSLREITHRFEAEVLPIVVHQRQLEPGEVLALPSDVFCLSEREHFPVSFAARVPLAQRLDNFVVPRFQPRNRLLCARPRIDRLESAEAARARGPGRRSSHVAFFARVLWAASAPATVERRVAKILQCVLDLLVELINFSRVPIGLVSQHIGNFLRLSSNFRLPRHFDLPPRCPCGRHPVVRFPLLGGAPGPVRVTELRAAPIR